jgi:hypothetical protein
MTILADLGDNFENLPAILEEMELHFKDAAKHLRMKGMSLDTLLIEQASWVGHYSIRHVELRTIRKFIESTIDRTRGKLWKHYTEKHPRELQYRDKEQYVNTEDRIAELKLMYHAVAEMEEKYEAMCDGLKQKGFMLNSIVKVKVAALDGAMVL